MNKDTYYELLINNFEELPMKAKTLILENLSLPIADNWQRFFTFAIGKIVWAQKASQHVFFRIILTRQP